ncbi:MAG: Beta-galactosidase C-terminal domain [Curtobacterium sp.]
MDRIVEERAIARTVTAPPGLEAVRRVRQDGVGILFLLNHTSGDVALSAGGTDLLDGSAHGPETVVPAGGVRVLLEEATA